MNEKMQRKTVELRDGLRAMADEAQGVWRLEILAARPVMEALITERLRGEQRLSAVATVGAALVEEILAPSAGKERPLRCLTCETRFEIPVEVPAGIVVITPSIGGARRAVINPLCQACWDRADVKDRTLAAYKGSLFGDMRVVHIGEPGHA